MSEQFGVKVRDGVIIVNSLAVSEHFDRRHDNVIRDVEELLTASKVRALNWFWRHFYVDSKGESRPCYEMTRSGFELLSSGFTGERALDRKLLFWQAFEKLEGDLLAGRKPDDAVRAMFQSFKDEVASLIATEVQRNVPKPPKPFDWSTRCAIFAEYFRQNPHGLDPTGRVRIFDHDGKPIKGVCELHHMNGPYRNGFEDGLPVAVEFHRKLTADKSERGEGWRKARTAHQNFLDKIHDPQMALL